MKKLFAVIFAVIFLIVYAPLVCGQESLADELGIDTAPLSENLTPEARDFIEEKNLTVENTDEMTKITPYEVLTYIWDTFKSKLGKPLRVFAELLSVILISAVISSTEDTLSNKSVTRIFGVISVLISVGIISTSVSDCIETATASLDSGGTFMIGYVPVFAGITASSGGVTSATAYSVLIILIAELTVQLASNIVVPSLSVCMAMGVVEAINPEFRLSAVTEGIKKAITFAMGFIMTVFIGLLSLQSIVGASADTLGVKAAKYVVSNFVPVVGGAVADTYTTVKHSLGLLRGGAGFIGIAAVFVTLVPPLLEILAMRLAFSLADIVSDIFGTGQLKILIKNTNWILAIIFSIMVCFSVMLIISTAILMLVGLNVA